MRAWKLIAFGWLLRSLVLALREGIDAMDLG